MFWVGSDCERYRQLELDGGMFLVTYTTGVVKSWMYWPIIAGVMFNYKYKKQKRAFDEANPGQVAMAWPIDHEVWTTINDRARLFLNFVLWIRSVKLPKTLALLFRTVVFYEEVEITVVL